MSVKLRTVVLTIFVTLLLASCATTGTKSVSTPSWVSTTPPPASGYTYFVGSGSDTSGNLGAANENAVHSLVSDLTRYLGVTVSSSTSVETRADLQSFQTKVTERIHETSSATVGDFSVIDRWIQREGDQVSVFLLGRYKTSALETEKARLAALQRERTDAVLVPEKAGDALLQNGHPYEAVVKYLDAALAASGANVENASVKFDRTMKKAIAAVASIQVVPLTDNLEGMVDEPLPHSFLAQVIVHEGSNPAKVVGVPFRVSYPVQRSGGRTGTETKLIKSDRDGNLSVSVPSPQLIGRHAVTAALDLHAELAPLLRLKKPAEKALVTSLEQKVNQARAVFHYTTSSHAVSIPTGVLVMDLDRGGSPIPADDAASGIVSALTAAGYDILPIPSNPSILGIDFPDLVKVLRNNFGSRIKRAVIGTARISGFEHSEGNYIVKVSGTVEVAELASGKVLFSTNQVKLSRASDATSAITAAFKDLGTSIGDEIRNTLH